MRKKHTKSVELQVVEPLTEHQIQEQRLALNDLVEKRKRLVHEGKIEPVMSHDERIAELNASRNIISIGDAMKEALPKLREMESKATAFAMETREKIAALELEECEEHAGIKLEVDEEATIGKSWKRNSFTIIYNGCPKCREEKLLVNQRSEWLDKGVPKKVISATFANYDTSGDEAKARALAKFKKQVKRGSGFIVAVGLFGTGKSHLAVATMKEVGDGLFVTEHDLVGELRQTYTDNSGQDALVEKYRSAKVLVIDELTKEVKGVDIAPLLYRVLGFRHDKDLLTVLTSNETLEDCMSILGPKLRDRMKESYTVANFTWKSHRQDRENL